MRRRSLALDYVATHRLHALATFYNAGHSAVVRLALGTLAERVGAAQASAATGDGAALAAERSRINAHRRFEASP